MKKTFVVLMGVVVMGFSSQAQDRSERRQVNPEKQAEWMMASLKERVELPEVKWEQLTAIKEEYRAGIKELRAADTGRPDRAEMKALKDQQEAKIELLLSEEEYTSLRQAMQEMRAERRQAHRGRRQLDPEQRAERVTASLKEHVELSEEKWDQFTAINQEYFAEMREQRVQEPGRPDRAAMKALKEKRDEKLKAVLTADEYAGLQQTMREMRSKEHEKARRGRRSRSSR